MTTSSIDTKDIETVAVSQKMPAPHSQYVVIRDGAIFTATPCYGMHAPWWVTLTMNRKEADPVTMLDDDKWLSLDSAILALDLSRAECEAETK